MYIYLNFEYHFDHMFIGHCSSSDVWIVMYIENVHVPYYNKGKTLCRLFQMKVREFKVNCTLNYARF
jgi:hypothetical protein